MSIACWNMRGFHNPNRKEEIKKLIGKHRISCFGIIEDKLSGFEIKSFEKLIDARWNIISNVSCYYKCRILVMIDNLS